ncbi:MAG TPA: tyrosinase family protein, partial [Gemmatimonadaceae bacterium]|nr:tyrosinase family protein [Gemmatimonadaceae bacterium]
MRCRKNVKDLSQDEKDAFIQAIEGLKAQDSTLHPGFQSRYDDYVEIHRSAMDAAVIAAGGTVTNPGWGHFDSAFFPWHRELLFRFEEELRAIKPGVTIPYWDWTRGQSALSTAWPFTHAFIGVDGTDANADRVMREPGAPSPYPHEFDPEAWTVVVTDNPGDPVVLRRAFGERSDAPGLPTNDADVTGTGTNYREAIGSATYLLLRARSEDLHNLVHRWANGSMISASSPNDPVFWMHHAQHDRMWTMWQEKHP